MSFLDQSEEPRTGGVRRASEDDPPAHRQTLLIRRSVAIVVIALVVVGLVFLVQGCLDARTERALTGYTRDAGTLVQDSNRQSDQFFGLLDDPEGNSPVDVQNTVNGIAVRADRLVGRVDSSSRPSRWRRPTATSARRSASGTTGSPRSPAACRPRWATRGATRPAARSPRRCRTSPPATSSTPSASCRSSRRNSGARSCWGASAYPRASSSTVFAWLQPRYVANRMNADREGGGEQAADSRPPRDGPRHGHPPSLGTGARRGWGGGTGGERGPRLRGGGPRTRARSTEQDVTRRRGRRITGAGRPHAGAGADQTGPSTPGSQTVHDPRRGPPRRPVGPSPSRWRSRGCEASAWSITTPRPSGNRLHGVTPAPGGGRDGPGFAVSGRSARRVAASRAGRSVGRRRAAAWRTSG